jgi:hypothetical protein
LSYRISVDLFRIWCHFSLMAPVRAVAAPSSNRRSPKVGPAVSPARRRRFAFLEEELFWKGEVGREVLSNAFALTPNHVTDDLATYKATCPTNLLYDEHRRRYRPSPRFRPKFTDADPRRYLAQLRAHAEGVLRVAGGIAAIEIVPDPAGAVDVTLLQALTRAIHSRTGLQITYQSLTTEDPTHRLVFPHALAHNGRRWYMRAYDTLRGEFRDFALARVLAATAHLEAWPANVDEEWETLLPLRLRPNPALHPSQRDVVAREYGMRRDGETWIWELKIRRAMVVYFLDTHQLRVQPDGKRPDRTPLLLENYEEIRGADWSGRSRIA